MQYKDVKEAIRNVVITLKAMPITDIVFKVEGPFGEECLRK